MRHQSQCPHPGERRRAELSALLAPFSQERRRKPLLSEKLYGWQPQGFETDVFLALTAAPRWRKPGSNKVQKAQPRARCGAPTAQEAVPVSTPEESRAAGNKRKAAAAKRAKSAWAETGSPAKKKKNKKKKKNQPGKYSTLVIDTIRKLGERNGSSLAKIYNEAKKVSWFDQQNGRTYLRYSIKALLQNDSLIQVKGTGANGSFKLNKKKFEKTAEKKSPSKVAKSPPAKKAKKPAEKKVRGKVENVKKRTPSKQPAAKKNAKPKKGVKKPSASPSKKVKKTKKTVKSAVPKVPKAKTTRATRGGK
ncbi:histone H1x [Arapaima gigas]